MVHLKKQKTFIAECLNSARDNSKLAGNDINRHGGNMKKKLKEKIFIEKSVRPKNILLLCSILFVISILGCGMESSDEPNEEEQQTTDELLAYQEILRAAPAIDGEDSRLEDASFDYDQNMELFGNHYDLFAIYDINQDEVSELIALSTVNFRWSIVSVYTLVDGDVVLLKSQSDVNTFGSFEQNSTANGAYITYICEKNHIHSVWRGTNPVGEAVEENYAYALEEAALNIVDCAIGESDNAINFYDIAKPNTAENVDAMIQ